MAEMDVNYGNDNWINPLLWKGYKKELDIDFGKPKLERNIQECGLHIVQPLLIAKLIDYFTPGSDISFDTAVLIAYWNCYVFGPLSCHSSSIFLWSLSRRHEDSNCVLLSNAALNDTTAGHMVNLLSNDVSRNITILSLSLTINVFGTVGVKLMTTILICTFLFLPYRIVLLHFLWVGPLQAGIATYILWVELGVACIIGIMILILLIPVQIFMGRLFWSYRKESKVLIKTAMVRAMNMAIYAVSIKLILFLTFLIYLSMGNTLTAHTVFLTVALYYNVRIVMTLFFPFAASQGAEVLVSIKRIEAFLLLEETTKESEPLPAQENIGITLDAVTAFWEKTSLLMAILQELPLTNGVLSLTGSLAYTSQQPWIYHATVRSNIIMGNAFIRKRYSEVIRACSLETDISLLPYGDQTLVGERGAVLSGGQKARVNLARALYVDADIYLLDDPFSAVDAEVGRHIYEKCICEYLQDKTRILVTHQLQFLQNADQVMVLKNISEHAAIQQIPEELRNKGSIKGNLYWQYIQAGGNTCLTLLLILFTLTAQVLYSGMEFWLAYWTNSVQEQAARRVALNGTIVDKKALFKDDNEERNLSIYAVLLVCLFVFSFVRCLLFYYLCVAASINLHKRTFNAVLRSPIAFFDANPVGRILNRFAKDIGVLDELLPLCLDDCIDVTRRDGISDFISLKVVGIIVLVCITNYWLIFPTIILGIIFILLRRFYMKTSRALKRLDSITRSPVFSHLSSTLDGLTTVRAFHVEEKFQHEFNVHQDFNSSAWFLFLAAGRWLAIYLDCLCNYETINFVNIIESKEFLSADPLGGDVGLAITSSLGVSGMFQWGVRQSAEVESQMISVERLIEYTKLEPEAALESSANKKPPSDWPNRGEITFKHVSVQYNDNANPVLSDLSFLIKSGEKIGIVGRTGAGKSTLIATLFRLTEPIGAIEIDHINIQEIGLDDVRPKISIIPQDPILFQGTQGIGI
uniref:ABC transmembrane type-1 domain-containing protein n=1 Tax=Strigamia maritima TaxID=126957 RepID=T1IZ28_STRMM